MVAHPTIQGAPFVDGAPTSWFSSLLNSISDTPDWLVLDVGGDLSPLLFTSPQQVNVVYLVDSINDKIG